MGEQRTRPVNELIDLTAIARAHAAADREALLEHARMGRSVSVSRDGKIVALSPAEIFARYGLDEFGRPVANSAESTPPPDAPGR